MLGDLSPIIRLSETFRNNWCPVEWQGHLNGVELDEGRRLWDGRGDIDNEVGGNMGEVFVGDGHDTADGSAGSFTYREIHKQEISPRNQI